MSRYLHLRAVSDAATARRRSGLSRASSLVLLGVMASMVAAFGLPMAAASATSAPRAAAPRVVAPRVAAPRTSIFCGYADNAAKGTSVSAGATALTPSSIEAEYSKLKSEETFVEANTPGSLKPDFVLLFGYVNKFISLLAGVHYNYLKLTTADFKTFETSDTKQVTAAEKAINSYLTNTCHIKTT
jgi:Pyruvate/2-oxoacid:ferredoxin oxidoreductase gamma subunit